MQQHLPFTVLKQRSCLCHNRCHRKLQQHLPFTVLKHTLTLLNMFWVGFALQQHLPFTVLKLHIVRYEQFATLLTVATALTVYGIETNIVQLYNYKL